MRKLISRCIIPIVCIFFLNSLVMYGLPDSNEKSDFPNGKENKITDPNHTLAPFFRQLHELTEDMDSLKVISVVHLGDSHIQADFQTSVTRYLFQKHFGCAGRGLIAPLKLAKTNEPRSYNITSPQTWEAVRCIRPATTPVGITGMVLIGKDSVNHISIETLDKYNPDRWNFNDITAFYVTDRSKVVVDNSLPGYSYSVESPFAERIKFNTLVSRLDMEFISASPGNTCDLYGFNLKNGCNGVLYHAIGINGAHYKDYADSELFAPQLGALDASLIIISMGTNEAYDQTFDPEDFYKNIDHAIREIRKYTPNAVFLLTTPAETWKNYRSKKRIPHPNMSTAGKVIVQYAADNNIAYWDLFNISGGKGSARYWRSEGFLSKDGVHFSKEGYEFLGGLFFDAVYKAYQNQLTMENGK